MGEVHLPQEFFRFREDLVLVALLYVDRRVRDVLHDGVVREQIEVLEDQAEVLLCFAQFGRADVFRFAVRAGRDRRGAGVADLTGIDGLEERGTAQERTLAGTGGADDTDDFARIDTKTDVFQDFDIAKRFFDVFHL